MTHPKSGEKTHFLAILHSCILAFHASVGAHGVLMIIILYIILLSLEPSFPIWKRPLQECKIARMQDFRLYFRGNNRNYTAEMNINWMN